MIMIDNNLCSPSIPILERTTRRNSQIKIYEDMPRELVMIVVSAAQDDVQPSLYRS